MPESSFYILLWIGGCATNQKISQIRTEWTPRALCAENAIWGWSIKRIIWFFRSVPRGLLFQTLLLAVNQLTGSHGLEWGRCSLTSWFDSFTYPRIVESSLRLQSPYWATRKWNISRATLRDDARSRANIFLWALINICLGRIRRDQFQFILIQFKFRVSKSGSL